MEYRHYIFIKNNNDNKLICLFCSRKLKFSGRNNPNTKYFTLDDNYFENLDSEFKAYLLGWIASDGHVGERGFKIGIKNTDFKILNEIKNIFCKELPIKEKNNGQITLEANSQKIQNDICNLLQIQPGKKSNTVKFPKFENETFSWAFIRGYFDGDGHVADPNKKSNYPKCTITSNSLEMLKAIQTFVKIPCGISGIQLYWQGNNALDFMGKLYSSGSLYLERKYCKYLYWCNWVPAIRGRFSNGKEAYFTWNKADKNAVPPFKARISDSGYDLTLIKKDKTIGNVHLYDTGIKVRPDYGWFFYLVGRSSIIKSGYILANSIGVIDRCFTGTIKVPLIKIDPDAPELEIPNRLVQIIPTSIIHMQSYEVDYLEETDRNDKGFGSSNNIINEISNEEMDIKFKERNAKRGIGGFNSTGNV